MVLDMHLPRGGVVFSAKQKLQTGETEPGRRDRAGKERQGNIGKKKRSSRYSEVKYI